MKREEAIKIYNQNKFDKFIPLFREEFNALPLNYSERVDVELSDENIKEHIISRIMQRDALIEFNSKHPNSLPYYVGKDYKEFVIAKTEDCSPICASLKRDAKFFSCKGRTMFAKGRCSEDKAAAILDEHRDEFDPIIQEIMNKILESEPDSPEKFAVIPYAVLECACFAIMFSPANLSPKEAVEQYLYDEIINEIRYLKA